MTRYDFVVVGNHMCSPRFRQHSPGKVWARRSCACFVALSRRARAARRAIHVGKTFASRYGGRDVCAVVLERQQLRDSLGYENAIGFQIQQSRCLQICTGSHLHFPHIPLVSCWPPSNVQGISDIHRHISFSTLSAIRSYYRLPSQYCVADMPSLTRSDLARSSELWLYFGAKTANARLITRRVRWSTVVCVICVHELNLNQI